MENEQHIHFCSRIGSSFPVVKTETEADASGQRHGREITETTKSEVPRYYIAALFLQAHMLTGLNR